MNVIEIQDREIYVIGDIHGEFHEAYARDGIIHGCIIVAGDVGFGFHNFKYYTECMYPKAKKWLERNDNIIICVRGNHDDPAYFAGKPFHKERMMCVPDYTVIKGNNHIVLCVGGAISIDRIYRKDIQDFRPNGPRYWWEDEAPILDTDKIREITDAGYRIDTVVSHTCPDFCYPMDKGVTNSTMAHWLKIDPPLQHDLLNERSCMTEIYHQLVDEYDHPVKRWMYGHYHASHKSIYDGMICQLLDINEIVPLPTFNDFGALEDLMTKYRAGECEHEELNELLNHRMITWSDWIDAQPESYDGYDEWLQARGLKRNNRNAKAFIEETEDRLTE